MKDNNPKITLAIERANSFCLKKARMELVIDLIG